MNVYFNYKGSRRQVHTPLLKVLVVIYLIVLFLLSLPFGLILWLLGFEGFFHDKEWVVSGQAFRRKRRVS